MPPSTAWYAVLVVAFGVLLATPAEAQPTRAPPGDGGLPSSSDDSGAFFVHAAAGVEHYRAGRFAEALREFDQAVVHPGPPSDVASVHFNAAACLFSLERYAEAEQRFLESAALDPERSDLARLNAGLAAARAGHLDVAQAQLDAVHPTTPEEQARREELAEAIREAAPSPPPPDAPTEPQEEQPEPPPAVVLPMAGVHGWALLSVGYDSNAAQSGVGDTIGATPTDTGGSAFGSAMMSLHGTHHFSSKQAGRIYYEGDWLALTSSPAREYSLQSHTIGVRSHSLLGPRVSMRLGIGGGVVLSGLEEVEPLEGEGVVDARWTWQASRRARTRLDLRLVYSQGIGDWDYLTGLAVESRIRQGFEWDDVELDLSLGVRHQGLGELELVLESGELPGCSVGSGAGNGPGAASDCAGETYVVPLGWWGPRGDVELMTYPHERLSLGARTGVEYRRYHDESFVTGVSDSRKLRTDVRWRAGAGAEMVLHQRSQLAVLADYRLVVSRSNVAYDAADPEHYLDYDDRNFVQHVVEFGVFLPF